MPPWKRPDPRTATVLEELFSSELQKTTQAIPSSSSSHPQPSTSALRAEPHNLDPLLLGLENLVPPLLGSPTQHSFPQHSSSIHSLSRTKKPHNEYLIGY